MTALDDDERAELARVAAEAQRRLDERKAAEARGEAPSPFGAIMVPGKNGTSEPGTAADGRSHGPLPVRPWWCGECGEPGTWRPYPLCPGCADVDRRRRLAARLEAVRQSLPTATDGARLGAAWLVGLVGHEAQSKALAYAKAPGWLTLEGPSRAGKTSLAAAIFRRLVDAGAREAATEAEVRRAVGMRFVPARLLRKAHQEHALGKGEPALVGEARRATVLVLDDLGNEGPDRGQAVGDVLFDRHEERLPTVVTTGLSADEVESRYGAGLKNRLWEGERIWLGGGK